MVASLQSNVAHGIARNGYATPPQKGVETKLSQSIGESAVCFITVSMSFLSPIHCEPSK